LGLRREIPEYHGAANYLIVAKENGVTALRSIGLAEVGFKCGSAIVTVSGNSSSTEFVE
jgi:hypothetical protein